MDQDTQTQQGPYCIAPIHECDSLLASVSERLQKSRNIVENDSGIDYDSSPVVDLTSSSRKAKQFIIQQLTPVLDDLESILTTLIKPLHLDRYPSVVTHHQSNSTLDIQYMQTFITDLEFFVDYLAYSYENENSDDEGEMHSNFPLLVKTIVPRILVCIAHFYQLVVCNHIQHYSSQDDTEKDINKTFEEIVADAYLDWAIASKRAHRISDCFYAHLCRMQLCPSLAHTDALRLLGSSTTTTSTTPLGVSFHSDTIHIVVDDVSSQGIFELDSDLFQNENKYYPSQTACRLGKDIQSIFSNAGYTMSKCRSLFLQYTSHSTIHDDTSCSQQIFSASVYLDHRHEIPSISSLEEQKGIELSSLDILSRLFLFGLTVPYDYTVSILGQDNVNTLLEARMIRISPACSSDVLGEVQVFPISPTDLFLGENENMATCLFMTDWSIESLRSRETAVMSVGYDTMELMALAGGWIVHSCQNQEKPLQCMDLCCGCGIQGLFAFYISTYFDPLDKVVCLDVNTRACHFVSANIALNQLGTVGDPSIYAMQSNVLNPLPDQYLYGNFDCILCNPPFVAVPISYVSSLNPAQYAVGGGINGMKILKRILRDSAHLLKDNCHSILLMVTELPNIEESDNYMEDLLSIKDNRKLRIRIAYVKEDVEELEVYNNARSSENGITANFNWAEDLGNPVVTNRALALISVLNDDDLLQAQRVHSMEKRFCFEDTDRSGSGSDSYTIDEEDAFLTRAGIDFVRDRILYQL